MSLHWQIIIDVYIYILYIYIYIFASVVYAFAYKNKTGVANFWLTSMGSPQNKRRRMPMSLLQSKLSLDRLCSHETKAKRPAFLKDPALQADLTTEATNLAGTTAARFDLCLIGPTYVLSENLSICALYCMSRWWGTGTQLSLSGLFLTLNDKMAKPSYSIRNANQQDGLNLFGSRRNAKQQ